MNSYQHLADAAWIRLVIVGFDILAVVVVVRVWAMLTAWWRAPHPWQPVAAIARPPRRPPGPRPARR